MLLFLVALLLGLSAKTVGANKVMPIATFDSGSRPTERGGWYNFFQRSPSQATVEHSDTVYRGSEGHSLLIQAKRATSGWCGAWIQLAGDWDGGVLDTSHFSHIVFFVKGTVGDTDDFVVKMADTWNGDGKVLGKVQSFIPNFSSMSTTDWRQVLVPLSVADAKGLDRALMTTLSFEFRTPGEYEVYIDDIYFVKEQGLPIPASGPQSSPLAVDTFDRSNANTLEGYFHALEQSPSAARVTKDWDTYRGQGGKSWQITANKATGEPNDWCGAWMHFLDAQVPSSQRIYLDATNYNYLTFWIKGKDGGENVNIRMADRRWMELFDDSVPVGHITEFLSGDNVTPDWQQAVVPLTTVEGILDLNFLGNLVFDFDFVGHNREQVVYIDDVYFISDQGQVVPESTHSTNIFKQVTPPLRSLWVWDGIGVVTDAVKQAKLWEVCDENNVGTIWLELPLAESLIAGVEIPETFDFSSVWDADEIEVRSFLKTAHDVHNIEVHALAGDPAWAKQAYHHVSLNFVDGGKISLSICGRVQISSA